MAVRSLGHAGPKGLKLSPAKTICAADAVILGRDLGHSQVGDAQWQPSGRLALDLKIWEKPWKKPS